MPMKKAKNIQIAKVQPKGIAQLLLDFCQIQAGVAYKIVAYKKTCSAKKCLTFTLVLMTWKSQFVWGFQPPPF